MAKKPMISDEEYLKLKVREGTQILRERVPHCFSMPILTIPECNHLVGGPKYQHLCDLRHSCALAYAERLGLDVSEAYSGEKERQFPTLVEMIQEKEREIKYVPRIGRAARQEPVPAEPGERVVDEASMSALITEQKLTEEAVAEVPQKNGSIRDLILRTMSSGGWMTKGQIIEALEVELNRRPLNVAVKHKISLTLLPKSQQKFGYGVDRETRKEGTKTVHYYRLQNGQEKQT